MNGMLTIGGHETVAVSLLVGAWPAATRAIAGRFGLISRAFTPAMVFAIFEGLTVAFAQRRFAVGIDDQAQAAAERKEEPHA